MGEEKTAELLTIGSPEENGHASRPVDAVPDGGFRAWLQVAGTFCIYLNTWLARYVPVTLYEGLRLMVYIVEL